MARLRLSGRVTSLSIRGKFIKSSVFIDVPLTLPYTRRDDAEFALETGQEDDNDDTSADEEDLSTKIAILERLRGRRGKPFRFLYRCESRDLICYSLELEQVLGIPFPVCYAANKTRSVLTKLWQRISRFLCTYCGGSTHCYSTSDLPSSYRHIITT
jgi:hypothetical protein